MASQLKPHINDDFIEGLHKGAPVFLGYFPVSFAFGIMAVNSGLPPLLAVFISLTNFTSAGQLAGAQLIALQAPLLEIGLTVLVINLRYLLMSFTIAQKILHLSIVKKLLIAFGITDEIFVIASLEKQERLSSSFFAGLITGPYIGWACGTVSGVLLGGILGDALKAALNIAIYAMFIAIIIPEAKRSAAVLKVVLLSSCMSALFFWAPFLQKISKGFSIIIITVGISFLAALLYPRRDERTL